MFAKLAVVFASAAAIASAMPTDPISSTTTTINKCNVGSLQCCQSIQSPHSKAAQEQLGLLNLAAGAIDGLIGVQCNPISVLGALGTGSNCNANPVCCKENKFNGVVAIGCTPVNVNV